MRGNFGTWKCPKCGAFSRAPPPPTKRCGKCGVEKPIEEFYHHTGQLGHRSGKCRTCAKSDNDEWQKKHPGYRTRKVREHRQRNPGRWNLLYRERADIIKARRRQLYREKHEKYYGYIKGWVRGHPERAKETNRRWARRHPEKILMNAWRRKARTAQVFVEDVDPLVVAERDNWTCFFCHMNVDRLAVNRAEKASIHHVIPITLFGDHAYHNIRLAHVGCNASYGNGQRRTWQSQLRRTMTLHTAPRFVRFFW